jgi:hypothetical protein
MSAYKGTDRPGVPQPVLPVGPNTGLGHSSIVFMIEAQIAYVRDAIKTMNLHRYASSRAAPGRHAAWNDALQRRMKRTVWNTGGCSSWYLDERAATRPCGLAPRRVPVAAVELRRRGVRRAGTHPDPRGRDV